MATDWRCGNCASMNAAGAGRCEDCGFDRPRQALLNTPAGGTCPFDGSSLHANGWCPAGDGWPITRVVCPLVCDRCRQALTWAGTCNACTSYAPGDRYEYTHQNPHWQRVEKGPFLILPPQQQAHMAAEFEERMLRLQARMTGEM